MKTKYKKIQQKFTVWELIATGDIYYSYPDPELKEIEGEKFFEATPDFCHPALIKHDAVRKTGSVVRDWNI